MTETLQLSSLPSSVTDDAELLTELYRRVGQKVANYQPDKYHVADGWIGHYLDGSEKPSRDGMSPTQFSVRMILRELLGEYAYPELIPLEVRHRLGM